MRMRMRLRMRAPANAIAYAYAYASAYSRANACGYASCSHSFVSQERMLDATFVDCLAVQG